MTKSTTVNTNSSDTWHTLNHIQQSVKNTVASGCSKVATFAKDHPWATATAVVYIGFVGCLLISPEATLTTIFEPISKVTQAVRFYFMTPEQYENCKATQEKLLAEYQNILKEEEAIIIKGQDRILHPEQHTDRFFILNNEALKMEMAVLQQRTAVERLEPMKKTISWIFDKYDLNTECGRYGITVEEQFPLKD